MVKLAVIILSVFLLVTSSEAGRKAGGRIIDGVDGKISELPYIVTIQTSDTNIHFCGGSIIAPTWILTAAHCPMAAGVSKVRANSNLYASGGKTAEVLRVIRHISYNPDTYNSDIALVELASDITGDNGGKTIALPNQDEVVAAGQTARVSGWGFTTPNSYVSSEKLKTVLVDTIGLETCKQMYSDDSLTDSSLCAASPGKDSCTNDSGGPLVLNDKLIGVVSWGIGCAEPGHPGVYVNVAKFRNWITTNSGV